MQVREIVERRLRSDWPRFVQAFMKRVRKDLGKSKLSAEDLDEIWTAIQGFNPGVKEEAEEPLP